LGVAVEFSDAWASVPSASFARAMQIVFHRSPGARMAVSEQRALQRGQAMGAERSVIGVGAVDGIRV